MKIADFYIDIEQNENEAIADGYYWFIYDLYEIGAAAIAEGGSVFRQLIGWAHSPCTIHVIRDKAGLEKWKVELNHKLALRGQAPIS